jgi:hypothetical protein
VDISLNLSCSVIYHLGALYAQALDANKGTDYFPAWEKVAKSVIADIGEVHKLWNSYAPSQAHVDVLKTCKKRGELLEKRFKKLHLLMNVWVTPPRWAKVVLKCEDQWLKFLEQMTKAGGMPEALHKPVMESSRKRRETVAALSKKTNAEAAALSANYGIPSDLSKVG